MSKLTTASLVVAIVVGGISASVVARQQQTGRVQFEYLRATVTQGWSSYQACVATATEWACRDFPTSTREMFATLGNEGWELVSAMNESHDQTKAPRGLTYMFKRQR
jgi:hypothetical protein